MAVLAREQKIADRLTGVHAYKYKITKVIACRSFPTTR